MTVYNDSETALSIDKNGIIDTTTFLHGVVFSRSVRAHFCILHLVAATSADKKQEERHVVVRVQFQDDNHATFLRSWCRRSCQFGDYIRVRGIWKDSQTEKGFGDIRLVVNLKSPEDADSGDFIRVEQAMCCTTKDWQAWQNKYLPKKDIKLKVDDGHHDDSTSVRTQKKMQPAIPDELNGGIYSKQMREDSSPLSQSDRHGGGLSKRIRSEHVKNFLIRTIMHKLMKKHNSGSPTCLPQVEGCDCVDGDNDAPASWSIDIEKSILDSNEHNITFYQRAINELNQGSGVIDAAGGSGHVSMALGLSGIKSTVVDPRKSAGKLPGRDRKVWYRALKQERQQPKQETIKEVTGEVRWNTQQKQCGLCSNIVPYSTFKAWFAREPQGVDASFRHPDAENVPVCTDGSELLDKCSAIVALHPDEATDSIVDMAVKKRIPFVIVPCCVFFRLFSDRKKPNGEPVSTYFDLLEYLIAKHEDIRMTTMPFAGANHVLWATF